MKYFLRILKFLLIGILCLSYSTFSFGQNSSEIEDLKRIIAELEQENLELKSELKKSDETIQNKDKILIQQDTQITAYRESERKAREEKRKISGSNLGRDRGPGGAIKFGSITLGGAIRANYISGDYNNGAADGGVDGPSRDNGTVNLGTLILNGKYESSDFVGFAEYRFYDNISSFGGTHFLNSAWLGKVFNDGSTLKVGIQEVPFGIERFGSAYGYLNHLDYVVGLSDDRDLGLTYSFVLGDWDIDLGYFVGSEPEGCGESENSSRGSYDVVTPYSPVDALEYNLASFAPPTGSNDYPKNNYLLGNFSPWEEGEQINVRLKKEFYTEKFDNVIGLSYQYGELDSTDTLNRFDKGEAEAKSIFIKSTSGMWQIKASLSEYHYDIDKSKENILPPYYYNPDQIVIGGFDTPFFIASKGTIHSLGVSYTIFPKLSFLDFIVPYLDYSKISKDGETNGTYYNVPVVGSKFKDSEQFSIGSMFGIGQMLIYADLSYGKGSPLIGNNNSQYFTGASFNDSQTGLSFDDNWQHRFTINFGYYY